MRLGNFLNYSRSIDKIRTMNTKISQQNKKTTREDDTREANRNIFFFCAVCLAAIIFFAVQQFATIHKTFTHFQLISIVWVWVGDLVNVWQYTANHTHACMVMDQYASFACSKYNSIKNIIFYMWALMPGWLAGWLAFSFLSLHLVRLVAVVVDRLLFLPQIWFYSLFSSIHICYGILLPQSQVFYWKVYFVRKNNDNISWANVPNVYIYLYVCTFCFILQWNSVEWIMENWVSE